MPTPIKITLIVIGFFLLVLIGYLVYRSCIRYSRTRCPNCKHKYNYQRDILPQVKSRKEKKSVITYRVEYECFCRHCGKERSYFAIVNTSRNSEPEKAAK